jgi:hypothetical protein
VTAQNTRFYIFPQSDGYEAELIQFTLKDESIFIVVDISPEVWEYVDMNMFFNLTWNNRGPGEVSGSKPVQLGMYLGKDVYKELVNYGNLLTDAESFLAAPPEHPMKGTKNWYVTQVTEEVDLPPELQDKGSLRSGFITDWKQEFEKSK